MPKIGPKLFGEKNPIYRHGMHKSPEYKIWGSMKRRCNNPNDARYSDYGGRGIKVYPAWDEDFRAFIKDVGMRPSKHYTLDRIDNDRGYEPGNVRWATRITQNRNQRGSKSVFGIRRYRSGNYQVQFLKASLGTYKTLFEAIWKALNHDIRHET